MLLVPDCVKVRHEATSVNNFKLAIRFPGNAADAPLTNTLKEVLKYFFIGQLEQLEVDQEDAASDMSDKDLVLNLNLTLSGGSGDLKLEQTGLNWIFKNLRVPKELNGILPLGLRKHFGNHLFQKLTHTQLMSACHIENNRIQTFDHKIYHYELNDCNHILFKDCSRKLPVAVLARSVPGAKSSKIIEILSGVSHLIVKAKNPKVPGGDLIIESKVNSRRKKSIELKNLTSTHFEFCSESKDVLFAIRRYTDNVYSIWFHKESLQV